MAAAQARLGGRRYGHASSQWLRLTTHRPSLSRFSWVGIEDIPILFANQFLLQFQPGEFMLAIGQATPPAILGTPEEMAEQLAGYTYVPVRTIARVGITRQRLQELIAVLQANLDNHDRATQGLDPR